MNMNATSQMVTVSQGGKPREKPATGDDRPSRRPSIEHGEDYLPDRPVTDEWTVYSVMKLRQKHWHEEDKNNAIAIAHNAELAAAWRKGHSDAQAPALERIDELHKQLAAERKKLNDCLSREFHVAQRFTKLEQQLAQVTKERDNTR